STRVQFGLLGDDNFGIAVSPDGSTFDTALVISSSLLNVAIGNGTGYAGLTIGAGDGARPHLKLEGGVTNPVPSSGDIWQDKANRGWLSLSGGNYLLSSALIVDKSGSTNNLFLGEGTGNTTLTGTDDQASNNILAGFGAGQNLTTGARN